MDTDISLNERTLSKFNKTSLLTDAKTNKRRDSHSITMN